MMLKAAGSQAKAISGAAPVRLNSVATSVVSRRRHAAFKSTGRQAIRVKASAEESDAPSTEAPAVPEPAAVAAAGVSSGGGAPRRARREVTVDLASVKPGDEFEGTVTAVEGFGAFVNFGAEKEGLVHISQLANKFVGSADKVVSVNQVVKVRVLSFDVASGKIALTMKGATGAAEAEDDDEDYDDDGMQPEEGHEFVYADASADFQFPFQMEEEDGELTVSAVAEFEEQDDLVVERVMDIEIPLNALVTGTITRVEDYGAFVSINWNGKEVRAFLERDEAKIPSAGMTDKELAEYVEEGDDIPVYISTEFDDMKEFYKEGDKIEAFVLEYTDKGMNLTQYTDAEVEADGLELGDDDDEGEISDEVLSVMGDMQSLDVMALMPEDLLEDTSGDSDAVSTGDGSVPEVVIEYQGQRGPLTGGFFTKGGNFTVPSVNFPDRPLEKANSFALSNLQLTDTDFDGDEIYLEELWQQTIHVPKDVLKKMGLKIRFDEKGESEVYEGVSEGTDVGDVDVSFATLGADQKARVAAFVDDLMEADEGEAEFSLRAMRRPLVYAVAVQSIAAATVKSLRDKTGAGMMDCKKALLENDLDEEKATEWLRQKGLSGADKKSGRVASEGAVCTYIHPGSRLGVLLEVNCETDFVAASDKFQALINELGMIIAASPDVLVVNPEDVPAELLNKEKDVEMGKEDIKNKPEAVRAKIVEGRIEKIKNTMALVNQDSLSNPSKTVAELVKETTAALGEKVSVRRFERFKLGEGLEKRSNDFAAEVAQQMQAKAAAAPAKALEPKKEEAKEEPAKAMVQVAAKVVKELRDKTGAGMMDCKKALGLNDGDMEASIEWLRKKGLAGADKKGSRLAAEGVVASYIHPGSRLGVLLEVNCETDFVAASDGFQALVNGLAMQLAASPMVQYVSAEDIPAEVYAREKEIEMGREDLMNKTEAIRAKIAEGRVQKLAQEMALLPQPYLMDNSKTVDQAVKEAIAAIGEKISVRRFVKYQLGEGIEKKTFDLAADVASMTGKSA